MLEELQRLNRRTGEAQEDQQPQGEPRYADRFRRGRDGRLILYGDDDHDDDDGDGDGDGDYDGGDGDHFYDAREYIGRRPRPRRQPAVIDRQDLDDIRDQQEDIRQQQQLQELQRQLLDQRPIQQQQEEEIFEQQVQQQQQQELLKVTRPSFLGGTILL